MSGALEFRYVCGVDAQCEPSGMAHIIIIGGNKTLCGRDANGRPLIVTTASKTQQKNTTLCGTCLRIYKTRMNK